MKIKNKSQRELKKNSLMVKWAFASSFFIFIIFTFFAIITYRTATSLIVKSEQKDAEQTTYDAVSRLANGDQQLNKERAYQSLIGFSQADPRFKNAEFTSSDEERPLSDFGQPELSLYVYDLDQKLVFTTAEDDWELTSKTALEPTIISKNNSDGFLIAQPVYSKESREIIGYVQSFYDLTAFYEIKNQLRMTLIFLEIMILVISALVGYLLSAHFLKPLKTIKNTMEEIQANPQADIHAPQLKSNDELADMAAIFNEMLDRMRSYTEQQEQFVEDVSHELRTPVAVIEGHLSMLKRWGKDDPEILAESIDASLQEITRMKTLVQDMLDLSRAEQVDIYYKNEVSSAKEVIYQVFNNFKMLHPDFMFTLDDDLAEEKQVKIYRDHFEQILIIIMDNAVKYSSERKEIHLSISSGKDDLELAIQDFGDGIAPEDIKKIFHRFYRVDKARSRLKGGNGLGLSIVKKLLDSYKGSIVAESSLGQGTIFRITLPLVKRVNKKTE